MSNQILFIDVDILKDRTQIHGNVDDKLIIPEIKVAQDMYLEPVLGTPLFQKFLTLIDDGTITSGGNAAYKTLLDNYIIDCMIWRTMMLLPVPLTIQFYNKGAKVKDGDNDSTPSMTELADVSNEFRTRAEHYENRLRRYLIRDKGTLYPEWEDAGDTEDDILPRRTSYSMPIYLDDEFIRDPNIPVLYDPTKCR